MQQRQEESRGSGGSWSMATESTSTVEDAIATRESTMELGGEGSLLSGQTRGAKRRSSSAAHSRDRGAARASVGTSREERGSGGGAGPKAVRRRRRYGDGEGSDRLREKNDKGKPMSNPRGWPDKSSPADLEERPNREIVVNGEQKLWFCSNFVRTSKV